MNKIGITLTLTGAGADLGAVVGGTIGFRSVSAIDSANNVGYLADGSRAMSFGAPSPAAYAIAVVIGIALGFAIGAVAGAAVGLPLAGVLTRRRLAKPASGGPVITVPPGWYQRPGATWGYWNGQAWTDSRPPQEVAQ